MIFSHSRLSCFEQCPRKFKYRYVDEVGTEIQESIEAFLGKRVHEALEKIYKDAQKRKINSIEEITEFFNSSWEKNWSDKILMVRGNDCEAQKNMGMKFLSDYCGRHSPFNSSRTIGLEMPIKFSMNGFKIRGFIDRLSLAGNNIEIHDYKTSSRMAPLENLERDRQLHLYAMAARKMYPFAKGVELVWHFLAFNKEVRISASEERMQQVFESTASIMEKINSEKEFPAKQSALCAWCEYQKVCGK